MAVTTIATGDASIELQPDGPLNSSTMELPVFFSQLCDVDQPCASPAHPRITYSVLSFGLLDLTTDSLPGTATLQHLQPGDQYRNVGRARSRRHGRGADRAQPG